MTLAQHWMGRTRDNIHPDYRNAFDTIALVPEILERSACLVAMNILDKCLSASPIASSSQHRILKAFVNGWGLPRNVENALSRLATFSSQYGWSKYVFAALRELTNSSNDKGLVAATMHEVAEFMDMCDIAKMDAFAKVLNLVASQDDTVNNTQSSEPTGVQSIAQAVKRVRAPMLRAMLTRRDRTFDRVFIKPADMVLRAGRHYHSYQQRANDLQVHGSNMYRALLLSTLGINAWDTPDMDEGSHSAPDFLKYISPTDEPLKDLWNPTTQTRSSMRSIHLRNYVDLDCAFIVNGNKSNGAVGNQLNGNQSSAQERRRAAQYVEAFASFFSKQVLANILVNKFQEDPEGATSADLAQRTEDRKLIFSALKALGVATPDEEDMNTFLYDDDYNMRMDNVDALMQFLGMYKVTRQECAPIQSTVLVSPYKRS